VSIAYIGWGSTNPQGEWKMINIWGVCEYGEMTHDPLRRWDLCCHAFSPGDPKRVEGIEKCCANCTYWLIADECLAPNDKGREI